MAGQVGEKPSETAIRVELVDRDGTTVGTEGKLDAHLAPGRLHRAFSVFLFDARGRLLLQRRAGGKYHSPLVWSNTCCGHPHPGEAPFLAAARRTAEELGAAPVMLAEAGTVVYELQDPDSGLVEREYNHLFVGEAPERLRPDPDEVAETAFASPVELAALRERSVFSVWFTTVLEASLPEIRRRFPEAGW
ncbi:isopentenyl-diphosphate Delta-isomerase [Nocardiopsis sp. RSe5-2]|uniref:Isopentenyl-diphosphate Delta-isomerase n=1 Tax=Nocardiopsis endophytica TaxID=3018445 RepID=A0ABT4U124_9ACTN|nr:isopentenyl-diphosphate Delta-isomerase [Nocardiopsis endophytica]MDA2810072.1 isopentenyl-diphosphate Delta-isomerase [Nocardiopsis endophytica]